MSSEEREMAGILLAQYATILQKEINGHLAKLEWAKHNLHIVIGKNSSNYGDKWTKFDERSSKVIVDNIYAISLNKMIIESTLRIKSLEFLAGKIFSISQIFTRTTKRRYEDG